MKTKIVQRREFLKSTVAAGVGLIILPSGTLSGANAPSNKLNVAMIGTWGRADAFFDSISKRSLVMLKKARFRPENIADCEIQKAIPNHISVFIIS